MAPLTDTVYNWAMSAGDRESEAQAKKGEEGAGGDRDSRAAAALKKNWCVGLRITELVITVIAIGLVTGALTSPYIVQSRLSHIAVIFSAYSSYIIITGILILARLFGESAGWKTSIGFSVLGVVMFTAAAAVIFYDWHTSYYVVVRPNKQAYDLLLSSGVFAVLGAAVFMFHAFFTFRKEADI
ncbi:uncharacterized protein LOC134667501 isoform X1 [Cydia fagiglandana]|uniref:uncharacterized protein LOC134667501 isoform X1 n=2 Tax=Cydia fagiglandana TaxID=1458189 RepID=UPI002FEE2ACF